MAGTKTKAATSANHTDKKAPNSNRTFCKDFMQLSCGRTYNAARMTQSQRPQTNIEEAKVKPNAGRTCESSADAMICERCGKAEMYRMHAVWRCPECGFKTDCCGW